MSAKEANGKGISQRVFCKVDGRTEMIVVADATQPVSALMDMVRARFQTTVGRLAIMDCELRWDDIILDVIRDGDVVEGITSGTSASARRNGDHGSSTKGSGPRQSLGDSHSARDADHGTAGQAGSSRGMSIHDRYRKLQKFKGGVMGTVFKAQDMASKGLYREVVVKLLQTGATRERQERFLREAKIVAGLNHPNIINYVDMGQEHDGTLYIVMEAVNGPDLQFILDHERYLFEDETLTIIKGVLNGLACTHAMHVVHRDLKPANILVLLKGNAAPTKRRDSKSAPRTPLEVLSVKIIDFGLARELSSSSLLTGENVVGTPMYFAPEQTISGAEISTLTDIWAVGVLIFHAICGTLPFAKLGDPLQVIVHEICTKPPPDLCAASQGRASPELRTVVESALQKNTHRRLPSAEVMLQRIHEVQSQHHPFSHRGQAQAPGASPRSAVVTVLGDATATAAHKHAAKSEKHLRHELAQLEQALQGREQQARVAQQQQSKLLQQHKEQQREIESLQEKLRDLTRANDDFHHTIKTQHQEAARAKQRMVDLQQENQRLQSRSQHKQAVDDELRSQEVEALKSEVEQLRSSNAALQVEVEESTTVLREKTQSLDTTQRHVKQVIQQALSKDKQIKEYERELKDASAKLLSMTAERDAAQERAQEAQQKALRDQQDWKKERQAIQQQLDSLQAEAARSAAVPAEHAALGAEAQRRMREAHELKDKAEAELRRTIEELSKSREAAAAAEHRAQQQLVQVNELKAELTSNHKGASEEEWKAKLGEVAALQLELASHKQQIGVLQQRLEAADAQQIALQVDLEARVAAENGARLRAETAEQMLSRSSRELQQVREQARLLRLQVEELEGDLKFEQDAVEQHKAALQKVEFAVDHVKRENDVLQQERQESSIAAMRALQLEHALASSKNLEASQKSLIQELQEQLVAERKESTHSLELAHQVASKTAEMERLSTEVARLRRQLDARAMQIDALQHDLRAAHDEQEADSIRDSDAYSDAGAEGQHKHAGLAQGERRRRRGEELLSESDVSSGEEDQEDVRRQQTLMRLEDEIAELRAASTLRTASRSSRWNDPMSRPISAEPTGKGRVPKRSSVSPPAPALRRPQSQAQYLRHPRASSQVASSPGRLKGSNSSWTNNKVADTSWAGSSTASSRSTRYASTPSEPGAPSPARGAISPSGRALPSPRRRAAGTDGARDGKGGGMLAVVYGTAVEQQVVRLVRLGRNNQQILAHYAIEPHGVTEDEVDAMRKQLAVHGYDVGKGAGPGASGGKNKHGSAKVSASRVQVDSDESEREELLEVRFGSST